MEETLGSIRALTTYFASVLDETTGFCPSLNAGAAGHQRWGDPPQAAGHRHPGAVAAVLHPALAAAVQLLGPYSVGAALPGTPPDPCHAVPSLCLTSLVSSGCRGQDAGRHVRARRAATDKPLHGYPYASSAAQGCVRACKRSSSPCHAISFCSPTNEGLYFLERSGWRSTPPCAYSFQSSGPAWPTCIVLGPVDQQQGSRCALQFQR